MQQTLIDIVAANMPDLQALEIICADFPSSRRYVWNSSDKSAIGLKLPDGSSCADLQGSNIP